MKHYYTLNSDEKGKYEQIADGFLQEKKSKFISYVFPINNKEEAIKYIDVIRNDNKEARHVIYIYSYLEDGNVNIKFSDDGEPQGTGTRAIYELMTKEKITNICIIIVRYFGGILLGAGPLSRAYLNTARDAIMKCKKDEIHNYIELNIKTTYNDYNNIKYICSNYLEGQIKVIDTNFDKNICIKFMIQDAIFDEFKSRIEEYIYQ